MPTPSRLRRRAVFAVAGVAALAAGGYWLLGAFEDVRVSAARSADS